MRGTVHALIIVVGLLCAVPGSAHDHATGVVKERMEMMEAMAKRMKAIGDRIKGRRDLGAIRTDALAVREMTPHMTHLFPPGSTQPPTDAKAAIWQNWGDFEAKAKALEVASANLANANPNDLNSLVAQVRATSQACAGCHDKYRTKR